MAGNIKGISIEIGGDTTKLDKALQNVNKASRDVNKNLRSINKSLRFNPGNTELVAQKQRELAKQIENTKEKLETLKKADEQAKQQLANGELGQEDYDALQREIIETESKLKHFEEQLKSLSTTKLDDLSKQFKEVGEKITAVGDKIKDVGKGLSAKVTAPIAAIGAGAIASFKEVDKGLDTIRSKTGATGAEMEKFKQSFNNLYGSMPVDSEIVGSALGEINTQFGLMGEALEASSEKMIKFAHINEADVTASTIAAKGAMEKYGLEAEDLGMVLDSVTKTAQNTGVSTDRIFQLVTEGSPQIQQLGLDFAQAAEMMGRMEQKGIDGKKALSYLTRAQTNWAKEGKSMVEGLKELEESLANATTEEEKLAIAAEAFGTKGGAYMLEALEKGAFATEEFANAQENAAGAVEDTWEGMLDPIDLVKQAMNNLKITGAELGTKLQEVLLPVIEDVIEHLQNVAKRFGELDPEIQESIVKFGLLAAAIGPVLLVIGSLVSSIGSIASGIGGAIGSLVKLKGAFSGVSAAVSVAGGGLSGLASVISGVLLGPVGIAVGAVAALGAAGLGLANYLRKDAIPETQGFGDAVSESTKKAMEGYLDLEKQATVSFNQLAWGGQQVTEEMKTNIVGNFQQMADSIITKAEEQKTQVIQSIQGMVDESTILSEEEKTRMVELTQQKYDEQIVKVQEGNEQINEIMSLAAEENRALTEQEKETINSIKEEMRTAAVTTMSESAAEQKAILEGLKADSAILSAEQAAEVVRNATDQKKKTIEEANQEYNERMKAAVKLKEEGSAESKKLADKIIKEATRQRDESIRAAEEMHQDVVNEAKNQAKDHVNEVDWETGEILSRWETMKKNTSTKMSEIKEQVITGWNETKEGTSRAWREMKTDVSNLAGDIKKATTTKFNEIKTSASQTWENIKTAITRPIEQARDGVKRAIDTMKGFFNFTWSLPKIKLPHFSMTGKFSLNPPSVPRFGVQWYKEGGIFEAPSIIGVGEAGSEAVLPTHKLDKFLEEAVKRVSGGKTNMVQPVINIDKMIVRDDTDIQKIARELFRLQQREGRSVPI